MDRPEKPTQLETRLADIDIAVALHVDYRQTGTDTADTFWVVSNWNNKKFEFQGGIPMKYLDFSPDYRSVFQVRKEVIDKVKVWKAFEKSHEHELAEYERLKKKFG